MSFIFPMNRFVLYCFVCICCLEIFRFTSRTKLHDLMQHFSVFHEMKNKDWVFFLSYFVTLLQNFTWISTQILENNKQQFIEFKQNIKSLQQCDISFHYLSKKKVESKKTWTKFVRMWQNQQLLVRKMYNILSLIS